MLGPKPPLLPTPPQLRRDVVRGTTCKLAAALPLLPALLSVRYVVLRPALLLPPVSSATSAVGRCQEGCCSWGRFRRGINTPWGQIGEVLQRHGKDAETQQHEYIENKFVI